MMMVDPMVMTIDSRRKGRVDSAIAIRNEECTKAEEQRVSNRGHYCWHVSKVKTVAVI